MANINTSSVIQLILAGSIIYLASALLYFAASVPQFSASITQASESIDKVSDNISAQVDPVLVEVRAVRMTADRALEHSAQYQRQLPETYTRLDNFQSQLVAIQEELPQIYSRVDKIQVASSDWLKESQKWQPTVENVVAQLQLLQQALPANIDRLESLISQAKDLGSEAGSGMVSGLLKGVITLPTEILGGLAGKLQSGDEAINLSQAELEQIGRQAFILLNDASRDSIVWYSENGEQRGVINKGSVVSRGGKQCRVLEFTLTVENENRKIDEVFCKQSNGQWQVD